MATRPPLRHASPELASQLRAERSTLEQMEAQTGAARIGGNRQRLAARREADEAEIALTAANRELQSAQRAFELGAIPELELAGVSASQRRPRGARRGAGAIVA